MSSHAAPTACRVGALVAVIALFALLPHTAHGSPDRLFGGPGRDTLLGGPANDRLVGGLGLDTLSGGAGNDRLESRDGVRDRVSCGAGKRDVVVADRKDVVARDCETVRRR